MNRFSEYSLEEGGLITISHSIPKQKHSKTMDFRDIKYLLIDPHGSSQIPLEDKADLYLPSDSQLIHALIQGEKDAGVPELCADILQRVPDGMTINVNFSRAILDANRTPEYALGKIVTPESPEMVSRMLHDIHRKALTAIDNVIGRLPPHVKILCLHSMKTNYVEDPEIAADIQIIRSYLEAWEQSIGMAPHTPVCLLLGPEGEEALADMKMKDAVEDVFRKEHIATKVDDPYKTVRNKDKTTDYMLARPGSILALDFPKDLLCRGSAGDHTFSYISSEADPVKVSKMGEILAKALRRVL